MRLLQEFNEFLREYKVLTLAIAFIIGRAITDLTNSLVNDLLMPLVSLLLPAGLWSGGEIVIGSVVIAWGSLVSSIIDFLIIAFIVFMLSKLVLKEEKVSKK